jgi:hypothetical protein
MAPSPSSTPSSTSTPNVLLGILFPGFVLQAHCYRYIKHFLVVKVFLDFDITLPSASH